MHRAEKILIDTRSMCCEWMETYENLGLNPEVVVSTRLSQEVANLREKIDIQEKRIALHQIWE